MHPSPSSRSTHLISFLIFLFINLRFQTSSSSPPVSPSSLWQEWRLHTGFQTNNPSRTMPHELQSQLFLSQHSSQRQFSFSPKKVKGLAAAFNSQVTQTWPFLVVLPFIAHNSRVHIPSHVFIQAGAKGPCFDSANLLHF